MRALFPQLDFISCLAISACLTPTDPIICAAIVGTSSPYSEPSHILLIVRLTGGKFARKHVPINLRQLLSAESAANDGLAYPFLSLSLYLTLDKTREAAITHWVLIGWLCLCYYIAYLVCFLNILLLDQVVLGIVLGSMLGECYYCNLCFYP